jgi:hypothetical protein
MARKNYEKISEKVDEQIYNVKQELGIENIEIDEETLSDSFPPSELEQIKNMLDVKIEEADHYGSLFIRELRKMRKIFAAAIEAAKEDNIL